MKHPVIAEGSGMGGEEENENRRGGGEDCNNIRRFMFPIHLRPECGGAFRITVCAI